MTVFVVIVATSEVNTQEAANMFKLISDFFLLELELDWVSREEIHHVIGVLMTNGFENDHDGVQGESN